MKSLVKILCLTLLVVALQAVSTDKVWPRPINMTVNSNLTSTLANPC